MHEPVANRVTGHRARLTGGGDLREPDPRKRTGRHHGHARPAHVGVRRPRVAKAGGKAGAGDDDKGEIETMARGGLAAMKSERK